MHDFHDRVKQGIKEKSGFKLMLWGGDEEMEALDVQNKLLSAMYDDEKTNFTDLTYEQKKEILEVSQLKFNDYQDMSHKYIQMREFHQWLLDRQE